ncbi:tyrosine-type recombinase/integrase [Micromonospora sp. NPDC048898]|uniref:tyrosine-type recombinase/integrase n=1 Tax=Micromonospora sp. NPDC048898 TaxID=3364260 RepID=UPI003710DEC2
MQVLRAHRRRRLDQRTQATEDGKPWPDSEYVFFRTDGLPINPNYATTRFRKLVLRTELPPVRLHDLRHGAASLAHEAGADLKTLQDLLGHASIVTTADTYTSVLPDVQRCCPNATARLVLTSARRSRSRKRSRTRPARTGRTPTETGAPTPATPAHGTKSQVKTPKRGGKSTQTTTPTAHPRDTHGREEPDSKKGPTHSTAGRTPDDLVRPKGLEPLTF